MRFLRLFPFLVLGSVAAYAIPTTLTVTDYSFDTNPSPLYPDNGTKLTDGVAYVPVWPDPSVNTSALVGWENFDYVTVHFNFGQEVTLNSASFYFADSDGSAGVYYPSNLVVHTDDFSYTQGAAPGNPPGSGTTVPFTFSFDSVTTDHIDLTFTPDGNWNMMSEATFSGTSAVPEPSTYAAIAGALALGFVTYRRRQAAAAA